MHPVIARCHRPLALASLLQVASLPAQSPAPMAETAITPTPGWSADDAMVFQQLTRLAEQLAHGGAALAMDPAHSRRGSPFGPAFTSASHAYDGDHFAEPGNGRSDAARALYVWPGSPANGASMTFCLSSDGRLLVAADHAGYAGAESPEPDAATGAGSRGRPADLLSTPGKGRDGRMWQTAAMVPTRPLALDLRDEQDQPVANGRIALAPRSWVAGSLQIVPAVDSDAAAAPDLVLPAGQVDTDAEGHAELRGVWVRDLVVCVGYQDGPMVALGSSAVQLRGHRLALTLPKAQLQQLRSRANESAAIATLKNISSAQAQCQASGVIDANQNGAGEYGYFAELSGAGPVRADSQGGVGTVTITPPVLSRAFAKVEGSRVVRSGYVFQIFLPSKIAAGTAEHKDGGGAGVSVDAAKAEVLWCCYAWPVEAGATGQRAFFINQGGDVLACSNADGLYSGAEKAPAATAAFLASDTGAMFSKVAANQLGKDGKDWRVIN